MGSRIEYCMGCGHEISDNFRSPCCNNEACWMYGLVVARVFTSKPQKDSLRRLQISDPPHNQADKVEE